MAWYWHVVTCGVVAAAAAAVETFDVKSFAVDAALQYLFAPCHPIQFAGSLLVYNMQCLVSV